MTIYSFDCVKCEISFEGEGRMSNPPKRKKCPQCGKQAHRSIIAPAFAISGKAPKWDKSDKKRMLNEMINDSKERLNNQKSPYARYDFDFKNKKAVDGYGIKVPDGGERKAQQETAKKIGSHLTEVWKRKKV